jgi:hypothetical protein
MSESREYPYQNAGELGFGWIFPCEGTRCDKSCSTLKEGGAVSSFSAIETPAKVAISRADDVCYVQQ